MRGWAVQMRMQMASLAFAKRRNPERNDIASKLLAVAGDLDLGREQWMGNPDFSQTDLKCAADRFVTRLVDRWQIMIVARFECLIDDGDIEDRHVGPAKSAVNRSCEPNLG